MNEDQAMKNAERHWGHAIDSLMSAAVRNAALDTDNKEPSQEQRKQLDRIEHLRSQIIGGLAGLIDKPNGASGRRVVAG